MSNQNIIELDRCTARVGDWGKVDAVVFVHGIAGDFRDTWGEYSELLHSDPELPNLDILLWGYRTGFLPQNLHGTNTLGHNLISELRVSLGRDATAFLVAHSKGELIVFQGLVEEMRAARAEEDPTRVESVPALLRFTLPD